MEHSRLLVFDPGPHTGVALLHGTTVLHTETIDAITSVGVAYRRVAELIQAANGSFGASQFTIVCERFVTVNAAVSASTEGQTTYKLAGFIEGSACVFDIRFLWQSPSVRKAWLDEAKSYHVHTRHEIDAVAHGLAYLQGASFSV